MFGKHEQCRCMPVCSMSRMAKATSDVDYPAYGSTSQYLSSSSESAVTGRKLAHSAQMFHYQHQKQQMLQLERSVPATSPHLLGTEIT